MNRRVKILTLLPALTLAGQPLFACAACYGDPDSAMSKGLTWAITALVGVVAVVLAGIVSFFVHTAKSAAAQGADEPTDDTEI